MGNQKGHGGSFRDKLTTIDESGKRVWILPENQRGNGLTEDKL